MPKQPKDRSPAPDDDVTAYQEQPEEQDHFADRAVEPHTEAAPVQTTGPESAEQEGIREPDDSTSAELEDALQRAVRLQAELENYRKRAQRTLEDERKYAALPLIRDLLTVLDNLQRAIDAAQQNEGSAGLLAGVEMVASQLNGILEQHHCEEIPAEGTRFDPNLHEAIAHLPSEDHEAGEISQVTQTGYQLHGRVVRPAQVIVAAGKPEEQ